MTANMGATTTKVIRIGTSDHRFKPNHIHRGEGGLDQPPELSLVFFLVIPVSYRKAVCLSTNGRIITHMTEIGGKAP
jgi:hypothetical protein